MAYNYTSDFDFPSATSNTGLPFDANDNERWERGRARPGIAAKLAVIPLVVLFAAVSFAVCRLALGGKPSTVPYEKVVAEGGGDAPDGGGLSDAPANAQLPFVLPVSIDRAGAEGASRIPIRITGTDAEGNPVDTIAYVDYAGNGVSLPAGTYQAQVIASPISGDGALYGFATDAVGFEVLESGATFAKGSVFEFVEVAAKDVTDRQIEDARHWIERDPERSGLAQTLADKAKAKRSLALAAAGAYADDTAASARANNSVSVTGAGQGPAASVASPYNSGTSEAGSTGTGTGSITTTGGESTGGNAAVNLTDGSGTTEDGGQTGDDPGADDSGSTDAGNVVVDDGPDSDGPSGPGADDGGPVPENEG